MAVRVAPGLATTTFSGVSRISAAYVLAIISKPALLTAYAPQLARAWWPTLEVRKIARPASDRVSKGCSVPSRWYWAVKFSASTWFHSLGSLWARGPSDPRVPALATRMSRRPRRSPSDGPSAITLSAWVRSSGTRSADPPAFRTASSISSSAPMVRATRTSWAPSAANARAVAAPMPREAPVIRATRPSSRFSGMGFSPGCVSGGGRWRFVRPGTTVRPGPPGTLRRSGSSDTRG